MPRIFERRLGLLEPPPRISLLRVSRILAGARESYRPALETGRKGGLSVVPRTLNYRISWVPSAHLAQVSIPLGIRPNSQVGLE